MKESSLYSSRVILAVSLLIVSAVTQAANDDEERALLNMQYLYSDLLSVEYVGIIEVVLIGEDTLNLGIEKDELTEFLTKQYKKNMKDVPYIDVMDKSRRELLYKSWQSEDISSIMGTIRVDVRLAGTEYPIAYYVEMEAGSASINKNMPYKHASLGIASKSDVLGKIKAEIAVMAESLGEVYFKIRRR